MYYKEYNISFYGKQYKSKPSGNEVSKISKNLTPYSLTYDFIAQHVGECGCTFAPAVFSDSRKTENFVEQQLFAVDIDDGVSFTEIKNRADKYRLPILFAYKSFSWSSEHEKFRVVFAMDRIITDAFTAQVITKMLMCIFNECDSHCSDLARMYYGSNKGLLYFSETDDEISFNELIMAVNCYMYDRYDESHYTAKIKDFYHSISVEVNKKVPVFSTDSDNTLIIKRSDKTKVRKANTCSEKNNRRRNSRIEFEVLKERCKLYRDFIEGNEWYYYPELFLIATNMVNMEKGKSEFLKILDSHKNKHCISYHERDWKPILNTIIDMNYKPMSCDKCPHVKNCLHYKNMICTVNPGYCGIRPLAVKQYCTIKEAEESLRQNLIDAIQTEEYGIKILKAQTGLGKTHTCLNMIKNSTEHFLVAVPTHKLIKEIMVKAKQMGIEFFTMPELKGFSKKLTDEIQHIYDVGAGIVSLSHLREILENMNRDDEDYIKLRNYFEQYDKAITYSGHILITHERFLNLTPNSEILKGRKVIIDEDIIRSAFATETVSNDDIRRALQNEIFDEDSKKRLTDILNGREYQRYYSKAGIDITEETPCQLSNINSNILDLLNAKVVINDGKNTLYMKIKNFPYSNAVVMSATANADIYKWLLHMPITEYHCKEAGYKGKVNLYTNSTYSRDALINGDNHEELIEKIKNISGNNAVITFKATENKFCTEYHFGGIEGLNCLEGQNISVVGLPNVDEKVYKLYGMLMGIDVEDEHMSYMKVQYNGYEFWMNTFKNYRLRTIQMWLIESLLEQAVGRARLLRYDCIVDVFARFPVDQSHFM